MRPRTLIRSTHSGAEPVNATPLIDVVLCMIIFFLIVGNLAEGQRAAVELPESASGQEDTAPESFVINLVEDDEGGEPRVMANADEVGMEGIAPALREAIARNASVDVQLRAPRDMGYGWIERVLELCAQAGVRDVKLATQPIGDGR